MLQLYEKSKQILFFPPHFAFLSQKVPQSIKEKCLSYIFSYSVNIECLLCARDYSWSRGHNSKFKRRILSSLRLYSNMGSRHILNSMTQYYAILGGSCHLFILCNKCVLIFLVSYTSPSLLPQILWLSVLVVMSVVHCPKGISHLLLCSPFINLSDGGEAIE